MFLRALVLSACLPLVAQQAIPSKPLPPPGKPVPDAERAKLTAGLARLQSAIDLARQSKSARQDLLPDAQIFHKAVDWALRYDEFHDIKEFERAAKMIDTGVERAQQLASGRAPWTQESGLVPLAYKSSIDDSLQPYGLVIPKSWSADPARPWRLDVWFHGRGETLSELAFLHQRLTSAGEFTPANAIVAHLYGRYCNANRFAGEVDLFEALADIKRRYNIDENRIVVRGFSMGGAATWHIAAHHAGLWAAAAPGAGFAETAEYLKLTPEQKSALPAWIPKLWNWYDATAYALNFYNLPLVAYSGEKDRQIQAAQVMERHLKEHGLRMTHIIGPNTEHKYHPDSKPEINRRIDALAERGRVAVPHTLRFTTHTLRYNRMKWLVVDELQQHWERAEISAAIGPGNGIHIGAKNTTALTLEFGPGEFPFDADVNPLVTINTQPIRVDGASTDLSWRASFHLEGGKWVAGAAPPAAIRKRHGLQGPVDDAFLSRFLFVRPTGAPKDPAVHAWAMKEMERAAAQWRGLFRGEVRIKNDTEVTPGDIAESNLVLWGDASSNQTWARMAARLPLQQSKAGEGLIMIYPNPLNASRYVVTNSGFTFREEANLSNARQNPMLPDWVRIDVSTPPDARFPGRIVDGGFFDENWKLPVSVR